MTIAIIILTVVAAISAAAGTAAQLDTAWLRHAPSKDKPKVRKILAWGLGGVREVTGKDRSKLVEREAGALTLRFIATFLTLVAIFLTLLRTH